MAIPLNQLRIGNFVHETSSTTPDDGSKCIFKIAAINKLTNTLIEDDETITSGDYIYSIPLDTDWLERFKFEFDDSWHTFKIELSIGKDFIISDLRGNGTFYVCDTDLDVIVTSVHELQNVFFFMTGIEIDTRSAEGEKN